VVCRVYIRTIALFVSIYTAKTIAIPTKTIGSFIVDIWIEKKSTGIGTYRIPV